MLEARKIREEIDTEANPHWEYEAYSLPSGSARHWAEAWAIIWLKPRGGGEIAWEAHGKKFPPF